MSATTFCQKGSPSWRRLLTPRFDALPSWLAVVVAGHGSVLRVPKIGQHLVIVAAEGPHTWGHLEARSVGAMSPAAVLVVAEVSTPVLEAGVVLDSGVYQQARKHIGSR